MNLTIRKLRFEELSDLAGLDVSKAEAGYNLVSTDSGTGLVLSMTAL